jgi:hypothetical protein
MPFNRLNHSILGEIRPRFYLKSSAQVEESLERMENNLSKDPYVSGLRSGEYIFLKTPKHLQHYWSPEMSVRIEESETKDFTRVCCLLGPRQTVWFMFTLIYSAITLITFFASIMGFVEYSRHGSSGFLWVIPIGIVLISSFFIVAKIGQKKGRDQMLHLVSYTYHALAEVGEVERLEVR